MTQNKIKNKLDRIFASTGVTYIFEPQTNEYKFFATNNRYICRIPQENIITMSDIEIWREVVSIFYEQYD